MTVVKSEIMSGKRCHGNRTEIKPSPHPAKKNMNRDSKFEVALRFAMKVPAELLCQPKGDFTVQSQRPYTVLCPCSYPNSSLKATLPSCLPPMGSHAFRVKLAAPYML